MNLKTDVKSRLQRLEGALTDGSKQITVRFARLRPLPKEFAGEKHEIVKRLPDEGGREWYEITECAGSGPVHRFEDAEDTAMVGNGGQKTPRSICVVFVPAQPSRELQEVS